MRQFVLFEASGPPVTSSVNTQMSERSPARCERGGKKQRDQR